MTQKLQKLEDEGQENISETTSCITIQCYAYDLEDVTHYDYFDYIGENGETLQFEPDSDMDFISFKELMKKEWSEYLKK